MQLFRYENWSQRMAASPELRACWAATQCTHALLQERDRSATATRIFRLGARFSRGYQWGLPPSPGIYCDFCGDFRELKRAPFDSREGLICESCGLAARMRACVSVLLANCGPSARLYVTEQATPLFARLQDKGLMIVGSEFESDVIKRERLTAQMHSCGGTGEVQFQDVTSLSFDDAAFDAILSCDVLEHVPAYRAAFAEFARVLTPGGTLVATFPFTDGAETVVRATLDEAGAIRHVLPPEYHGNPTGDGVLCFYHFGWDVLDVVRQAGFRHAEMVMPWAPQCGYHYGLWTLLATR